MTIRKSTLFVRLLVGRLALATLSLLSSSLTCKAVLQVVPVAGGFGRPPLSREIIADIGFELRCLLCREVAGTALG